MILQALAAYHARKSVDPDPARRLAAAGTEDKEIPFILELAADGALVGVTTTYDGKGRQRTAQRYRVPRTVKKTSGIAANLLWDNAEYVLALPDRKKLAEAAAQGKESDYRARLASMQAAFKARIDALPPSAQADDGIRAVRAFLAGHPAAAVAAFDAGTEIAASNPLLTFRYADDVGDLVCQRPAVAAATAVPAGDAEQTPSASVCLVSGKQAAPERLHAAIRGVWGAQTAGANIVSFNLAAFDSYGKEQGANAPVGTAAAFAYTTALNHLLAKGSRQRARVGSASAVFWAEQDNDADMEGWFAAFASDFDDPDAHTEQMHALYASVHNGRYADVGGQRRFYVLGLSPNAARIAVRFWHAAPVAEIAARIKQWFDDIRVVRAPFEPEYPALRRLLGSACLPTKERPGGDLDRLPGTLEGDVLRAIVAGSALPALLTNAVLQRCRAEQARKDPSGRPARHVTSLRAGLLRAAINRNARIHGAAQETIDVSLDKSNALPPYLRGRLFAVYERVQEDVAERDLNRTIRDAYFGAAMATPRAVFPRLAKLNQAHMRDLRKVADKRRFFLHDILLQEIHAKLQPATAYERASEDLHSQAIFTLGYYHQRQDFFRKRESAPPAPDTADHATIHEGL